MKSAIITLILITLVSAANKPYHKIVHVTDADARCLDGSPAFIYLSEGDPENILIHFMGGASCAGNSLSDTL